MNNLKGELSVMDNLGIKPNYAVIGRKYDIISKPLFIRLSDSFFYKIPHFFQNKQVLDISVDKGLVHSDSLAIADDGTPVVTSHR